MRRRDTVIDRNTQRKRTLAERIGNDYGWLLAQFVLLGIAFVAGPGGAYLGWTLQTPWPAAVHVVAGIVMLATALVIAGQARNDLGDSLRVAPSPLEDAVLIEAGWYARVRHPLYLAVLVAVVGWTVVWMSYPAFVLAGVIALFFRVKAAHEERMLVETYPDYASYMARVRSRFVPRMW